MRRTYYPRYLLAGTLAVVLIIPLLPWIARQPGNLLAQEEEIPPEAEPVTPPECPYFTHFEQYEARGPEALQRVELPDATYRALSQETEQVSRALGGMPGARTANSVGPWISRIDYHIFSLLQQKNIAPAKLAGDAEFLRRVTLDLIGHIPTAEQVQQFVADTDPQKRARAIDRLLDSPEWVDRWTMWLGDLLKNNAASTQINRGALARDAFYQWIKSSLQQNKPYNQMVSELITAQGDSYQYGPASFIVGGTMSMGPAQDTYDRQWVQTATMFLGLRNFDCLLCHDGAGHLDSVNLWGSRTTRTQAWGMAAFFSRARITRPGGNGTAYLVSEAAAGGYNLNTTSGNRPTRAPSGTVRSPVLPRYLFSGHQVAASENFRQVLAGELTSDLQFARATVNYVWAHFFGIGIVDPPDAFDLARLDPRNPPPDPWTVQPSHPALLDELAHGFVNDSYDLKTLMREITNSQAYQLSSRYDGQWDVTYTRYYARHLVRRLESEEMADAVVQSSGVPNPMTIAGYTSPFQWTMQLPDTSLPGGTVGTFLNTFLRGDRDENPRRQDLSVSQALSLMNDSFVINRVRAATSTGRLAPLLSASTSNTQLIQAIYRNVLSRDPAQDELTAALALFQTGTRATRAQDLLWALYNKVDFIFDY